jgi:hypothetical protein
MFDLLNKFNLSMWTALPGISQADLVKNICNHPRAVTTLNLSTSLGAHPAQE